LKNGAVLPDGFRHFWGDAVVQRRALASVQVGELVAYGVALLRRAARARFGI
jgi:hypothetical protein